MLVSNTAPMLAAVTSGGPSSWDRQDRRAPFTGRGLKRGITGRRPSPVTDRRQVKRLERFAVAAEIADWTDEPDAVELDFAYDEWERHTLAQELDDFGDFDDLGPDDFADCTCRRCLLHGDFGGCLNAGPAPTLEPEPMLVGDALTDPDLPGWGASRVDFSEFSTGFHIEQGNARRTGVRTMSTQAREHLARIS